MSRRRRTRIGRLVPYFAAFMVTIFVLSILLSTCSPTGAGI